MRLPADQLLTPRRLEVLRLAANGLSNAEIAAALWLAEDSVKSHMRLIYEVLGARDRANAVAIALVRGLIRPDEVELRAPRGSYPSVNSLSGSTPRLSPRAQPRPQIASMPKPAPEMRPI